MLFIMYIGDAKTETTNPMASYLSFEEKQEGKTHSKTSRNIIPTEEGLLSFFFLNESSYE